MQLYKSVYRAGEFRETINKSIFIAHVSPVRDDREDVNLLHALKKNIRMQLIMFLLSLLEINKNTNGQVTMENPRVLLGRLY